MRGAKKLYDELIPSSVTDEKKDYMMLRDVALAHRYYFYTNIVRKRYDDALVDLSDEFWITPKYIGERLMDHCIDLVKSLVEEQVTVADLRKKYPQWSWTVMRPG